MVNELNLLARVSKVDYDIYTLFSRTAGKKLIIDMDSLVGLYEPQNETDKENMPTIAKIISLYELL